jgi:hypothetical protein
MSNHKDVIVREDLSDLLGSGGENIDEVLYEMNLSPTREITFDQFKTIMRGGDQSPMCSSPYAKHRKRIEFYSSGI